MKIKCGGAFCFCFSLWVFVLEYLFVFVVRSICVFCVHPVNSDHPVMMPSGPPRVAAITPLSNSLCILFCLLVHISGNV